ncbi:MAG: outer membrane beta-barrel protein, partial [Beijerinckiaceae bacterium]|nr:outer membrane beta-barrel protein [Beijerinckiaceae bacterium]
CHLTFIVLKALAPGTRRIVSMARIKLWIITGVFGALGLASAQAADLDGFFSDEPVRMREAMVELGTGWYLRGDIAATSEKTPKLDPALAFPSLDSSQKSWATTLGFGYKYNNWIRTDLSWEYRNVRKASGDGASVVCPYQALTLSDPVTNTPQGIFYNVNETCTPKQDASMSTNALMLGGYIDLGTFSRITPYVGAGVGVSSILTRGSVNYVKTSDGTPYAADLTVTTAAPQLWIDAFGNLIAPQPNIAFAKQNWDRAVRSRNYNFAWSLMAGVAVDISQHAKLDIGYRYMDLGKYSTVSVNGSPKEGSITAHEVRAGIRYMID